MKPMTAPANSGPGGAGADGLDGRLERSGRLYERSVMEGDASALTLADRELDHVEASLALARGRVIHGRFLAQREQDPQQACEDPQEMVLFERAAQLYQAGQDERGEAEALFWVGCCHQVVRRDNDAAVPVLRRSLELAARSGDTATMSEALRHLGIADHAAGRLDSAREQLEESSRLRREAGQLAGVASNMVGLAYIAAAQDRRDDAAAILGEAASIAEATGAAGIMRHIDEARANLT
jgi:tetratricopeptide (TPR) repeat protein